MKKVLSLLIIIGAISSCSEENNKSNFSETKADIRKEANIDTAIPQIKLDSTEDSNKIIRLSDTSLSPSKLISCNGIGPVLFSDSYSMLEKKLGKQNLKMSKVYLEGEFQGYSTILWPGSKKEIIVYWNEKVMPFNTIISMNIEKADSYWKLPNGITVGSKLENLIVANGGKNIVFYGFGWDYGGTITSFEGGKMATAFPCISGILAPSKEIVTKDESKVLGDHPIHSNIPELKKYDVRLQTIIINPSK